MYGVDKYLQVTVDLGLLKPWKAIYREGRLLYSSGVLKAESNIFPVAASTKREIFKNFSEIITLVTLGFQTMDSQDSEVRFQVLLRHLVYSSFA